MPDGNNEKNKVIFGAEFDGQQIQKGVEEILNSLEKAQEAEAIVTTTIKENTAAMKANRKEAENLAKSKPINPKLIEEQIAKMKRLNEEYDEMVSLNAELQVVLKKTKSVQKDYIKTQAEHAKAGEAVSKVVKKFTNLNEFAADGLKKMTGAAKEAAFGLISGFAGGILFSFLPSLDKMIEKIVEVGTEFSEFEKNKKIINGVLNEAAKAVGDDVARLDVYRRKLNDTNIPAKERIAIAKEYNKTADETNQIDLKQIDNLELINQQIEKQNKLIIQRAISTAALSKLTEAATKFIQEELPFRQLQQKSGLSEAAFEKELDLFIKRTEEVDKTITNLQSSAQRKKFDAVNSSIQPLLDRLGINRADLIRIRQFRNQAKEEFESLGNLLSTLITPEGLTTQAGQKTPKAAKEVENVFEQKLAELRARLAAAQASAFQSEPLIKKKFEEQLDKEFFEIGKLLKEKKLTVPQADILKGLLKQINDVELTKGLEEFRRKRKEALDKVNDLILSAQLESETKRVALIKDEFEREQAQIQDAFNVAVAQITKRGEEFRKQVDADTKAGLISPELAKRKKYIAALVFGDLIDKADQARLNSEAALAFKQFQKTLELARQPFEQAELSANEATTRQIQNQTELFLKGKISYEKYQKELTKLLKSESDQRRRIQLREAQEELDLVEKRLQSTTDADQQAQLQKQRDQLRSQISNLSREIATGSGEDKNAKDKLKTFLDYANAVNDLATAIVGFWQQVNAAEAAALDRSIALQNKRVENAREVAEAGNAEYLEMEQKRLDELERKRADNARKQLAINNALATSQAIVAAITAISQAVQTGSPLAGIAAVAAVIGAIASAYSFVNSLQPQEANFFKGTEYVQGPEGRDKVKANLTKGERVVTARDNKDYWETLSAIHNRAIPPEALNSFVEAYPNIPMVDFDRLSSATEGSFGGDSVELLGRVDELNSNMKQMVIGLNELGINVNMDENGFEASISKARKRRLLRSRS